MVHGSREAGKEEEHAVGPQDAGEEEHSAGPQEDGEEGPAAGPQDAEEEAGGREVGADC